MPVRDLTYDFIRATSSAALAAYEWVGKGDGKAADGAAVESMRSVFDSIPFNGRVAIGEGEGRCPNALDWGDVGLSEG